MAGKNRGTENGGGQSNRFRFVLFEGELSEGNMGALAQAITTALRPTTPAPAQPRLPGRVPIAVGAGAATATEPPGDLEPEEVVVLENGEEPESDQPPKPKVTRERTYSKAKVMDGIDLETEVSFPDFAASKKPNNLQDKYLIAAAWFKLHRNTPAISMHHIYTCFLHPKVKWPTAAADFDQPLRQLVKADRLARGDRGFYVINTIGLADVVALGEA
jgi:hypothetical protein